MLKFEVPVDGGKLAVFRFGDGKGKPVLLIHGVTSSNRAFQIFAKDLIKRGKAPYAVDLRGRGNSNALPAPFGMDQHAKDMAEVIKYFNFEKPDVIGHSMGGFVTASLFGLYQELIGAIVLADGGIPLALPPGMKVEEVMPLILGPALARLSMRFDTKEEYREFWKLHPALSRGWSSELEEYVDYDLRDGRPSTNSEAVEIDSRDLFENELIDRTLKNLVKETLFIRAPRGLQNEDGGLYPLPMLEAVLPNYPKIKLVNLIDVNHYDMFLHPYGSEQIATAIYGEI